MFFSLSPAQIARADRLRFRGFAVRAPDGEALTVDAMREAVPSLFSVSRAEHLSERYAQIPTFSVVEGLTSDGWRATFAAQAKARDAQGREHTKHMVRLRREGDNVLYREVPELVLWNSHDGTSAFRLLAGVFRKVCSNGLVTGSFSDGVSVPHRGNVIDGVRDGATRIGREMAETAPLIADMRATGLDRDERRLLARHALRLRFDGEDVVNPDDALIPRREEDRATDLWTTINVVQEAAIRGGLTVTRVDDSGRRHRRSSRPVGSVDRDLRLNSAFFAMAREFHALKRGA